jgi:organic radical activating enzyme
MNNHFCPSPFIYISNNLEGKLRYCCLVHTGLKDDTGKEFHSSTSTLDEVWNSPDLNSVRDRMIEGTPIRDCSVCYNAEKSGGGSLRRDLVREWVDGSSKEQLDNILTEYNETKKVSAPVSVEVRTGSICNLKCRMCHPTDSILIEKEYQKFDRTIPNWTKLNYEKGSSHVEHNSYFQQVIDNLPNTQRLRFSGGEPLINDSTYEVIEEATRKGYSKNIDLFINTNFTKLTTDILENLKTFKTVNIDISIDGYKGVHEYVRTGIDWNDIDENLIKIRPYLNENFYITTNTTVQNLNVFYLEDILKWSITELNITPVLCVLNNPTWLAVKNMPPDAKVEATKRLTALINSDLVMSFKHPSWLAERIQSVIESIKVPADPQEYNRFLYFTQVTDSERKQNYRESIPELASYYEQYYPIKDL